MNMNEVIARINALAKKAKEEGLTPEETAERDKLRRIYIDSYKASLVSISKHFAGRSYSCPLLLYHTVPPRPVHLLFRLFILTEIAP